jgi:hypothetical protein
MNFILTTSQSYKPRASQLLECEIAYTGLVWQRVKRNIQHGAKLDEYTRHLRRCERLRNSADRRAGL